MRIHNKQYNSQFENNTGEKKREALIKLITSPEFQKPDGFEDIANRIDDAVIGSINLDSEDIYNNNG